MTRSLGRFIPPLAAHRLRHHLGTLVMVLAITLLVPLVAAPLLGEPRYAAVFAGISATAAATGWLLRRAPARSLGVREAMALTALAYLVFAIIGSVAFWPVIDPLDAFFESMSGFTTTGLTLVDVENFPRTLLLFRSFSQWLGGAGIIILSLVVLAGPGSAGAQLYSAEFGQTNIVGSVVATGRIVLALYAVLTGAGTAALWAAGAGGFDGLVHGLSLASTGGFSPFNDSFAGYGAPAVAAGAGVFMVLGATSLPLFYIAWRRGWRRLVADAQLRTLLVLVVVGGAVMIVAERGDVGRSVFHAISAVTTTGFSLSSPHQWSEGSRFAATGLMVVGGSLGSTAGGLKLLRLLVLLRIVGWALSRMMLPREARIPVKVQHAAVSEDEIRHTFALTGAYMGLLFVCTALLTTAGMRLDDALFEVVSGLSTVGLSTGVTSPELAGWAKAMLALTMWVGRIEILAALVLLHPRGWQPR